ncbi:MAG: epoxide hydrolase N-terminal domain-containing protein, partial [Novosphingobium sp.]
MSAIRPFTLDVPQAELDDLKARIDLTRWPEKEPVDDWSQGTPLAVLHDLMA